MYTLVHLCSAGLKLLMKKEESQGNRVENMTSGKYFVYKHVSVTLRGHVERNICNKSD